MHVKVNSWVDKIFVDEFAGMDSRAAGKYKGREECNSMTFAAIAYFVWQNMDSGRDIIENNSVEEQYWQMKIVMRTTAFFKITRIHNHKVC